MEKALLFGFVISSTLLAYTTYKNYVLLQAEKEVTRGLKQALQFMVSEKQKKTRTGNKK